MVISVKSFSIDYKCPYCKKSGYFYRIPSSNGMARILKHMTKKSGTDHVAIRFECHDCHETTFVAIYPADVTSLMYKDMIDQFDASFDARASGISPTIP